MFDILARCFAVAIDYRFRIIYDFIVASNEGKSKSGEMKNDENVTHLILMK